jgi:hypothetical protein
MLIKNYNYTEKEINMILTDTTNGEYIWVGFNNNGTTCTLQKLSAHNPLQKYYDLDLTVNAIKKGIISGDYIYLALDSSSYIARRYPITNPLTASVNFNIPAGITEAPVDILINTNVYLLIPGNISGTNTKIVVMTTAGVYVSTIDLSTVTNAISFTQDIATGDFWVITYTSPATYVRVYQISGGSYNYTINY